MVRDKVQSALVEVEWLRKRLQGLDTYNHKVRDINICRDRVLYYLFHVEGLWVQHEVLYEYSMDKPSDIEINLRQLEKFITIKCDNKTRLETIEMIFDRLLVHVKYNWKIRKIGEDVDYEIHS